MTAKRLLDVVAAAAGLVVAAPLLAILLPLSAIDGPPIYRGVRVGRGNRDFLILKLRSMTVTANAAGGTSTSSSDPRVTSFGRFVRRWKLDELPQLVNVLMGDMSMVGPRPNTRGGGVDRYTAEEFGLLKVRPGITDVSSIVFSDEGDILEGAPDPDLQYDRLIRPWKSRLGLLYVEHQCLAADLRIIALTLIGLTSRRLALRGVEALLEEWGADEELRAVCRRTSQLRPRSATGVLAE
jgi:lipopolysaccharide/colanic/teichoic acid biosynthesis glycosyltransferase